ncbi:cupin domain-containing protein [Maribacter sp.]|nr:cupin domain-containing protein [Maribacter sp.]
MIQPDVLFFKDDSITPNSELPVIVYRDVLKSAEIKSGISIQSVFEANNWTNNWADTIMTKNHYHSTTHEVIGINKGKVRLKIGGKDGSILTVQEGDVLLIPAGVGHFSLSNATLYEAIGGYPDGAAWDMIFDEKDKHGVAVERIRHIPIPKTDPIFGPNGVLFQYWK